MIVFVKHRCPWLQKSLQPKLLQNPLICDFNGNCYWLSAYQINFQEQNTENKNLETILKVKQDLAMC